MSKMSKADKAILINAGVIGLRCRMRMRRMLRETMPASKRMEIVFSNMPPAPAVKTWGIYVLTTKEARQGIQFLRRVQCG